MERPPEALRKPVKRSGANFCPASQRTRRRDAGERAVHSALAPRCCGRLMWSHALRAYRGATKPTRHDCPSCRHVSYAGSLRSPHRLRARPALPRPAAASPRRVLSALRAPNPTTLGGCTARSEKTYLERGPELTVPQKQ